MNDFSVTVKDWLVAASIGKFASSADWGIFISLEPDEPSRCITLYDVSDALGQIELDRDIPVDQVQVQVRVRAKGYQEGRSKMQEIEAVLASKINVTQAEGSLDIVHYAAVIQTVSDMTHLERDSQQRDIFTWRFRVRRWIV